MRSIKLSMPLVIAIAAGIGFLAVIINVISRQIPLPAISWLVLPMPFATVALGAFIVKKGWVTSKYIGDKDYFIGGLLFVAGLIICFIGFFGVMMFLFAGSS